MKNASLLASDLRIFFSEIEIFLAVHKNSGPDSIFGKRYFAASAL